MRVYFVGGFLGAGKTTAIVQACRVLQAEGKRVGVVTNDQGKLQVDTLFLRSAGLPAVEVAGGCFCCKYDNFDERLGSLVERERPDVVFAESVGSCADIVATVIKPFLAFRERYGAGSVFSVFADSRLLAARLAGRRLPFSEDVLYVFDRQLEEADLLVLNKRDLLSSEQRGELRASAEAAYPGKLLLELSAASEGEIPGWLGALDSFELTGERSSLDIDYRRYGEGERELAWLDERLVIEDAAGLASGGAKCRAAVLAFARELGRRLGAAGGAVGHVKLQVSAAGCERKVSLVAADFLSLDGSGPTAWGTGDLLEGQLPPFSAGQVLVSLNARAQCAPEELAGFAAAAAEAARRETGVSITEEDRSAFRPGIPKPTYRLG